MPADNRPRSRTGGQTPRPARRTVGFLAIAGLSGFAISQPVLSIAGANPSLFVFNDISRVQMAAFALVVALAPPLVLWGLILVARQFDRRLEEAVAGLVVVGLGVLAALQLGTELGLPDLARWIAALLVPAGLLSALLQWPATQDFLRYTAILPVLALVLFLFSSASSDLLRDLDQVEQAELAGRSPSILLLVFDELPTQSLLDDEGTIDAIRFPNFAAFAAESTWYRNFTSRSATTESAIPTMLTGKNPTLDDPLWTNHPDNLFSLLAPTHNLTVHESFTRMCGVSTCTESGPGQAATSSEADVDRAVQQLGDLWRARITGDIDPGDDADALDEFEETIGIRDPAATTEFDPGDLGFFRPRYLEQWPTRLSDFLDSLGPSGDPTLFYFHLLLPHTPWQFYDDGTFYANPDFRGLTMASNDLDWIAATQEQRHILQLGYLDTLLGRIVFDLEQKGLYDSTSIVIVADHGLSFDEASRMRRDVETPPGRQGTSFVPLLVKEAGTSEGVIDDQNLEGPDLLPLVAGLAGVQVPWEIDGALPGSDTIAGRGDEKVYVHIELGLEKTIDPPAVFDAQEAPPSAADRFIRPARDGDVQLQPLHELLDSSDLIGTSVDRHSGDPTGAVSVVNLADLERGHSDIPIAFVQGTIDDDVTADEILVAIDGTVVSGSPVIPYGADRGFLAMLPSEAIRRTVEVDVLLVEADGTISTATLSEA